MTMFSCELNNFIQITHNPFFCIKLIYINAFERADPNACNLHPYRSVNQHLNHTAHTLTKKRISMQSLSTTHAPPKKYPRREFAATLAARETRPQTAVSLNLHQIRHALKGRVGPRRPQNFNLHLPFV
jgi:hypothetical protein